MTIFDKNGRIDIDVEFDTDDLKFIDESIMNHLRSLFIQQIIEDYRDKIDMNEIQPGQGVFNEKMELLFRVKAVTDSEIVLTRIKGRKKIGIKRSKKSSV